MKKIFFGFIFLLIFSLQAREKIYVKFDGGADFIAEIASTPQEQALGLSFRPKTDDFAMLFLYSRASEIIFWMKDMNFSIDIIWIRGNKVVAVEEHVPFPNKLQKTSTLPTYGHGILADKVLEIPAGSSKEYNIQVGTKVFFEKKK